MFKIVKQKTPKKIKLGTEIRRQRDDIVRAICFGGAFCAYRAIFLGGYEQAHRIGRAAKTAGRRSGIAENSGRRTADNDGGISGGTNRR